MIEQIGSPVMLPLSAFPTTLIPSLEPVSSGGGQLMAGVHVVPRQADTGTHTWLVTDIWTLLDTHYTKSPMQILSMKVN